MNGAEPQLPTSFHGLIHKLEQTGFVLSDTTSGGAFGDVQYAWLRGALAVYVTSDRSVWSLTIGKPGWGVSFEADVWQVCLDSDVIGADSMPTWQQIDWLGHNLERILSLSDDALESLANCLREAGRKRMERRLGWSV